MYFNGVKKKKILRLTSERIRLFREKLHPDKEYVQKMLVMEAYTRAAFKGYFKLYRRDEFKVLASEKIIKVKLSGGILLGGKMDELVRDRHGDVWVKEYKFTSMMGEKDYMVRTAIDQQVSIYFLGALKKGPKGIIYDMTLKPYKKPIKHETMVEYENRMTVDYKTRRAENNKGMFYYKREELIRTKAQIRDLIEDIQSKAKRLQYMKDHKLYDKDTSCCNMYGLCEYFPLCANPKSSRNKLLYTDKRS